MCKLYQAKYQSPKNAEYLGPKTLMIKLCRLREISTVQPGTRLKFSDSLFDFHLTAILIACSENGEHGEKLTWTVVSNKTVWFFFNGARLAEGNSI